MSILRVNNIEVRTGSAITFSNNVDISGSFDAAGIVTARSGIDVIGGDINIGTGTSISSPESNVLALGTNNTEQLRIDSSGRLGVGTSTPGYRLDVTSQLGCTYSGTLRHLVNIDSDGGKSYWYNGTPTTTAYVIGDTGSAYFAGNVGIGTAVVGHKLDLLVGGGADGINVYNNATGAAYYQLATTSRSYKIEAVGSDLRFYDNTGSAERVRIDSSGNVGIGTASPAAALHVKSDSGVKIHASSANTTAVLELAGTRSLNAAAVNISKIKSIPENPTGNSDDTSLAFETRSQANQMQEAMRIDSSGRLLVGTLTGSYKVDINGEDLYLRGNGNYSGYANIRLAQDRARISAQLESSGGTPGTSLQFYTMPTNGSVTERMRISQNGNVKIQTRITNNTDDTSYAIDLGGSTSPSTNNGAGLRISYSNGVSTAVENIAFRSNSTNSGSASNYTVANIATTHGGAFVNPFLEIKIDDGTQGNLVARLTCTKTGVSVNGAFSKTSGSFRIDHPLESKKATHDLVHSFIEGPQADNIYRGQVNLVNGAATVNLDTAANMTEGTFVLLNTNISCFTSNESDWTAVRGFVSGNVLTIEAQDNTSTATVSWLVIGERHDQHMLDTDWTDENGRVITEPLKPSDEMNLIETP